MKPLTALLLTLAMIAALSGCGAKQETTELTVFAAASLQESLSAVIQDYEASHQGVTVVANYDSSGTLKTQIENGAVCDVFISAAPKQMNQLEELNMVDTAHRCDLLENKVVLAIPEGKPAGIKNFDHLAELLKSGDVLLAMGNSDVPVGQYTQKIFAYYGIDEAAVSSCLTYGSNVKEVTTQVNEGTVDCGIIYATDAFSAGLDSVDQATAQMCGQVVYPAAVMDGTKHSDTAADFCSYLAASEAMVHFEAVGFSPMV